MLFSRRFSGISFLSIISIASAHDLRVALRQSEDGLGHWGDVRFALNDPASDVLFVYDDAPPNFKTFAPRARRVLVVTEPPEYHAYSPRFLGQFGVILAPFALEAPGARVIKTQTGLMWWHGLALEQGGLRINSALADLRALTPAEKSQRLSVVCSGKTLLTKHRARLGFLERLRAMMGKRLVLFGGGFTPVVDKAEAITPFQYHLVLENNDLDCFWTEKLADAFLGWSLPFFSGGPGVARDFPEGALVPIDINDPEGAARVILAHMDAGEYQKRLPLIAAARERVLEEHNMFALFTRCSRDLPPGRLAEPEPVRQAFPVSWFKRLKRKLRSR